MSKKLTLNYTSKPAIEKGMKVTLFGEEYEVRSVRPGKYTTKVSFVPCKPRITSVDIDAVHYKRGAVNQ